LLKQEHVSSQIYFLKLSVLNIFDVISVCKQLSLEEEKKERQLNLECIAFLSPLMAIQAEDIDIIVVKHTKQQGGPKE